MSEITEAYGFGVTMKPEGKTKILKIVLISIYILFPLVCVLLAAMIPPVAIFCCLLALADAVLVFFTWRFVSRDYEYEIKSGQLTFTIVQNAFNIRIKKPQMEFMLKECTAIEPYNNPEFPESMKKYEAYKADKVYWGLSSSKAADAYFALYTDETGRNCAFLFEATGDTLKRCKWYNKDATVVAKTRI